MIHILIAAMLLSSSPSFARPLADGPITSGGDNPQFMTGSAWFLGDRTIRYCVEVSRDFGVSAGEAHATIERAFRTWREYVHERQIHHDNPLIALKINTQPMVRCDGSEDLAFHLGSESQLIRVARTKYEKPTAFAERTHYDLKTGWGKGFIWVAASRPGDLLTPNWREPGRLLAMILHEVGHVLGCAHMPGTIMREDIVQYMRFKAHPNEDQDLVLRRLSSIDGEKSLRPIYKYRLSEFMGVISYNEPLEKVQATFKRFTGRVPVGPITARFDFQPKPRAGGRSFALFLADSKAEHELLIEPTRDSSSFNLDTHLFKVSIEPASADGQKSLYTAIMHNQATVGYSKIKAFDGTEYAITMESNIAKIGPLQVRYFLNNVRQDLFQTKYGPQIK